MKSVGVFLASTIPNFDVEEDIKLFSKFVLENNLRVVYGGGKFGLMGKLYDQIRVVDQRISGITLDMFNKIGATPSNLEGVEIKGDFFSRKKALMDDSDFFFVFPGGIGTADELFDVLNHVSLGIENKNIYLFNKDGCWDGLLQWISKTVELGMIKDFPKRFYVESELPKLIERIRLNEF